MCCCVHACFPNSIPNLLTSQKQLQYNHSNNNNYVRPFQVSDFLSLNNQSKQQSKCESKEESFNCISTVDWFCIRPLCHEETYISASHRAQTLLVIGAKSATTDPQLQKQKTKAVIHG